MDDWKAGDYALCVGYRGSLSWDICAGPALWSTSTVRSTTINPENGQLSLSFQEWDRRWFYDAREFQRQELHEADQYDIETIRLMHGLPVKKPVG